MPHILTFSKLCHWSSERKEKSTSGIASNENIFLVSLGMAVCNFFTTSVGWPTSHQLSLVFDTPLSLGKCICDCETRYIHKGDMNIGMFCWNVLKKVQEAFFVTKRYTKEEKKWYDPRTEINVVQLIFVSPHFYQPRLINFYFVISFRRHLQISAKLSDPPQPPQPPQPT